MQRAREELHAEAMRNKAAKDNAIKENCPPLPDISAMAEGTTASQLAYTSLKLHFFNYFCAAIYSYTSISSSTNQSSPENQMFRSFLYCTRYKKKTSLN